MIVPDVNVLVLAAHAASPHHEAARSWWEDALSEDRPVGLPWVVASGFLRIVTSDRIFANPFSVGEALDIVDDWYARPGVAVVGPGRGHAALLRGYLEQLGRGANAVPDAHIAAIATEHGATLCSSDRGFARYEGLRWLDPLAERRAS